MQQQQTVFGQLLQLDDVTPREWMRLQQNRQHMDGREQSIRQPATALRRDRQMDLTPFKLGTLLEGAPFDQLHVNAGMTAPIASQKGSEQVCDDLRSRRNL